MKSQGNQNEGTYFCICNLIIFSDYFHSTFTGFSFHVDVSQALQRIVVNKFVLLFPKESVFFPDTLPEGY